MNYKISPDLSNDELRAMVENATAELVKTQHALWNEIDRHRKTEHFLRELEETHYRILDSLNCGIVITGREGKILIANSCLEKITGYSIDELSSKGFTALFPNSEHRRKLLRIFNSLETVEDWEIPLKRKDDSTFIALLNIECTQLAGKKAQIMRIQDITRQKSPELENTAWKG